MKEVSPAATSGTGNVCLESEHERDNGEHRARVAFIRAKLVAEGLGTDPELRRKAMAEARRAFADAGERFDRDGGKAALLAMRDSFDRISALWEIANASPVVPLDDGPTVKIEGGAAKVTT